MRKGMYSQLPEVADRLAFPGYYQLQEENFVLQGQHPFHSQLHTPKFQRGTIWQVWSQEKSLPVFAQREPPEEQAA